MPQRFANHGHAWSIRLRFLDREGATPQWLQAEHLEEIDGHAGAIHAIGALVGRDVERGLVVERDRLERLLIAMPHREVCEADAGLLEIPLRCRLVDVDQPLGLGEREWAEEQAIDEREHRDSGANAKGQHQDHQAAPEFLVRQRPPRISKVGTEHDRSPFSRRPDASAPPPLINHLHGNRVNEIARRVEPRQRRSHATMGTRFGEAVPEHRFHLRAVFVAEPSRSEAEQQSIAVHDETSPGRGLSRDLATFTSAARRSVSAASARWPARVSR